MHWGKICLCHPPRIFSPAPDFTSGTAQLVEPFSSSPCIWSAAAGTLCSVSRRGLLKSPYPSPPRSPGKPQPHILSSEGFGGSPWGILYCLVLCRWNPDQISSSPAPPLASVKAACPPDPLFSLLHLKKAELRPVVLKISEGWQYAIPWFLHTNITGPGKNKLQGPWLQLAYNIFFGMVCHPEFVVK